MKTKTVLLPIKVPNEEWCALFDDSGVHCRYLDDAFAWAPRCDNDFQPKVIQKKGYQKPEECRNLKEPTTPPTSQSG